PPRVRHGARQRPGLVEGVEVRARAEDVVRLRLDLRERATTAVVEEAELDGELARREVEERPGALEDRAGARGLEAEESRKRPRLPAGAEVVLAHAEVAKVLLRDVDAVALEVAARVLPEAGQRHRRRQLVAEAQALRVACAEDVEDEPT